MTELCSECREEPIINKKRQLGSRCYQRLRATYGYQLKGGEHRQPVSAITLVKYRNQREMKFIKNYFKHNNWQYEPATFRLNGEKYNPDFYDGERNVFIEVVGSRQAYDQNKAKYALMKKLFPKIEFEIRTPDGALLEIGDNLRVVWPREVNG